jgi:hypothetical protein
VTTSQSLTHLRPLVIICITRRESSIALASAGVTALAVCVVDPDARPFFRARLITKDMGMSSDFEIRCISA